MDDSGHDTGSSANGEELAADREASVSALWFFLPLPHPLGLPNEWCARVLIDPTEAARSGDMLGIHASIMIHQIERYVPVLQSDLADVTDLAVRVASQTSDRSPWHSDPDILNAVFASGDRLLTVAEVAIPLHGLTIEDRLDTALDHAIEAVRDIQNGVATTLRRSVRLMTRATLPPIVVVVHGKLCLDGRPPQFDGVIQYQVLGGTPSAYSIRPVELTDEELLSLNLGLDQMSRGALMKVYVDLRREAMVQRDFEGNGRLVIASLAMAGEAFLDALLLSMLWEEWAEPSAAAQVLPVPSPRDPPTHNPPCSASAKPG